MNLKSVEFKRVTFTRKNLKKEMMVIRQFRKEKTRCYSTSHQGIEFGTQP
jgi:hypothetical protein